MRLYQHLAVALARTDSDRAVLRYATKVARHVAAQRVDFVHVLPNFTGPETAKDHAEVLAELQGCRQTRLYRHAGDHRSKLRRATWSRLGPAVDLRG